MKIGKLIVAAGLLAVLAAWGEPAAGTQVPGGLALAQTGAVPPRPGKADDPPVVTTYGIMILLVAAIIGANLIPTKRGHQD